jgi:NAD(P)-dependent dehydrogenase (short-subunit alcohol dehydrogenase family)
MLLESKIAIVYGGAGAIGSAVARTFAAEGASVHLAGRTREPLEHVATGITEAGDVSRSRNSTRPTAPRSSSMPTLSPKTPAGSTSLSTPSAMTTSKAHH